MKAASFKTLPGHCKNMLELKLETFNGALLSASNFITNLYQTRNYEDSLECSVKVIHFEMKTDFKPCIFIPAKVE